MIEVENLTFTYARGARPAIEGLDFCIARGEIFGFLGPSGAGKSTTQKILIGLLKGYQGRVTVLGKDLASWKSDYYERIGVSFEFPNHFLKLTAVENLTYFGSLYSRPVQRPEALLDMVDLGDSGKMPVSQYSKGMKNRLSVARALLHDPEILFLDEPTSGLDPVNARRIKDLVLAQKQAGMTVFLTTHDMSVAGELCDRVAFLVEGKIRLVGAPRTLTIEYGEPTVRVEYQAGSWASPNSGHTARQEFPLQGLGENGGFLELLRGGQVQTIHTQEATLEDIFIRVTGRTLS